MKEKIYTIPVNEAFDTSCECPLCELDKKLDAEILDYILGPSYMEEDIREETNKIGFCKYHYDKMFNARNHLGVALMVSTHLKSINKELDNILKSEVQGGKERRFSKKSQGKHPLADYEEHISSSCYACKRMENRMNSYIETIFYLLKREPEFKQKIAECNGFCLKHFSQLLSEARKRMNETEFKEFANIIIPLQQENMARLDEELDWFIKKFDYRFQDEPWKNSKDALERTILKIASVYVNEK